MLEATARLVEDGGRTRVSSSSSRRWRRSGSGRRGVRRAAAGARAGFVYDHAGPIGEVILGAPYQTKIDVVFHGRAAHAGMFPEEGRSAIAAAARAIADLRLGRLDEETTANVGLIQGGTARNIVPEWCTFSAEARSHDERKLADLVQEMLDTIAFAANLGECEVETRSKAPRRATASAATT